MYVTIFQVQKHSTIYGLPCNEKKSRWLKFKEEPHNLKLSLADDRVNPFGELRSIYLVWPVFIINNNISPWMSIKRERIMLTMIVLGIILFRINIFIYTITYHDLSCLFHTYVLYFCVYSYMFNHVL